MILSSALFLVKKICWLLSTRCCSCHSRRKWSTKPVRAVSVLVQGWLDWRGGGLPHKCWFWVGQNMVSVGQKNGLSWWKNWTELVNLGLSSSKNFWVGRKMSWIGKKFPGLVKNGLGWLKMFKFVKSGLNWSKWPELVKKKFG